MVMSSDRGKPNRSGSAGRASRSSESREGRLRRQRLCLTNLLRGRYLVMAPYARKRAGRHGRFARRERMGARWRREYRPDDEQEADWNCEAARSRYQSRR